jgi:hypothetical protein
MNPSTLATSVRGWRVERYLGEQSLTGYPDLVEPEKTDGEEGLGRREQRVENGQQ